jgi:hypothetical protein
VCLLAVSEHSWIESGTGVEQFVCFCDADGEHGISYFSTAAGYSVLLLFFVRPVTNLYARRRRS